MAKQNSIFRFNGTIGGVTFYKTKDGYLAKEHNPVSGERIKTDPLFKRTRENMSEFGRAGKASKTLRDALRTMLENSNDKTISNRLTSRMMDVLKSDTVNQRGLRTLADGNMQLLEGFEFNQRAQLSNTLYAPYTVLINRVTGDINVTISSFTPAIGLRAPNGATHFKIAVAGSVVDFVGEVHETKEQATPYIKLDMVPTGALSLVNTMTGGTLDTLIATLHVQFYQQVNGLYYPLQNGKSSPMTIVKVDG